MKPNSPLADTLAGMQTITQSGQIRFVVSNSLLAVARGEMPPKTLHSLCKASDSVSTSMDAEVRLELAKAKLRLLGADIGKHETFGTNVIAHPNS